MFINSWKRALRLPSRLSSTPLLLVILAPSMLTFAQAQQVPAAADAAFEVASIQPVEWHVGCYSVLPSGSTHFGLGCSSLLNLIAMAWHVNGDDIQGGDRSDLSTLYDVRATVPNNKPWSDFGTIRPMLRQLLIERFHLSVHTGSRTTAGYGVYVAKNGAKLKRSDHNGTQDGLKAGEQPVNWITVSHLQGRGDTMSQVANLFSLVLREPVVDHTGLSGSYSIDLDFAPLREADSTTQDSTLPSFFSAVEDDLGLKLHREQVTLPTLVIDHMDASPTPN